MLTVPEQKTIIAMAEKLARAAVLAAKKERGFVKTGMTYDEAHRHETGLRDQFKELLKEVG